MAPWNGDRLPRQRRFDRGVLDCTAIGVRALIVALAVILMPGLVAGLLAEVAAVLAAIATWLKRSPLRQRLLVALLAVALLALLSVPYVGFPLLGAVLGAGMAYLEIKFGQEKEVDEPWRDAPRASR